MSWINHVVWYRKSPTMDWTVWCQSFNRAEAENARRLLNVLGYESWTEVQ